MPYVCLILFWGALVCLFFAAILLRLAYLMAKNKSAYNANRVKARLGLRLTKADIDAVLRP